jgi:hypothetical protein
MKNELNFNISNSNNISISDVSQTITSENPNAIKELVDVIAKIENELSVKNDSEKQKQLAALKADLKTDNGGGKIKSFLLSSGKWILDFAKSVGKEVLIDYVTKG